MRYFFVYYTNGVPSIEETEEDYWVDYLTTNQIVPEVRKLYNINHFFDNEVLIGFTVEEGRE